MVDKIGRLTVSKTEQQIDAEWAEVLSVRNRLLINSDWTQLPDSNLTKECVERFKRWRRLLRRVTKSKIPEMSVAREELSKLEASTPKIEFNIDFVNNLYVHKDLVGLSLREQKNYIRNLIFNVTDKIINPDNTIDKTPEVINERFSEASSYLQNTTADCPILNSIVKLTGKSIEQVVEESLQDKKQMISRMMKAIEINYIFNNLVDEAEDVTDLMDIKNKLESSYGY